MESTFIFIIHFHQPVGQLAHVFDRVQRNCYELLLRILEKHADLRVTLHFSGPLLTYWRENYPEFLERVKEIASRRNVEVLGGAFSEALLPLIPFEDRVEQLLRGRELVEEVLGVKPKGAWLAERVWDPSLPPVLRRAGYEYVVLDDEVGYRAGLRGEDLHRAWVTEYSGYRVGVFFIDAPLRYMLPWRSQEEVLNYLAKFKSPGGVRYALWGSDAEKFGEWWSASEAERWLEDFLSGLEGEGWVRLETPYGYLRKHGYAGLIYLPPGSYDKMMEWCSGYFPTFLRKYRESNNMHKKMLYVREKLERLEAPEEAWREYYTSQCNDAYWHGLFGGIYLAFLRQAVYSHLIRAERLAEERKGLYASGEVYVSEKDFDYDGEPEVLVESRFINAYFKPSDGGTLFELDIKLPGYEHNLCNTMSRYAEPYLEGVAGFRPDWYRRVSFREHVWKSWVSLEDWVRNTPFADASDFALGDFVFVPLQDGVVMRFTGKDWSDRESPKRIFLEKKFRLTERRELVARYSWRNMEKKYVAYTLAVEFTLAPFLPVDERRVWYRLDGRVERGIDEAYASKGRTVELLTEGYPAVALESSEEGEVWISPINSLSRTEKGLQEMFQALGVIFNFRVGLSPGEKFSHEFRLKVEG